MTPEDKNKLKRLLLATQKKTLKIKEYHKEAAQDSAPDNGGYTYHMADQGTDAMAREKNGFFMTREEEYLKQIEKALQLIEQPDYGICRCCHNEISFERMEAVPTTSSCVVCKNEKKQEAIPA